MKEFGYLTFLTACYLLIVGSRTQTRSQYNFNGDSEITNLPRCPPASSRRNFSLVGKTTATIVWEHWIKVIPASSAPNQTACVDEKGQVYIRNDEEKQEPEKPVKHAQESYPPQQESLLQEQQYKPGPPQGPYPPGPPQQEPNPPQGPYPPGPPQGPYPPGPPQQEPNPPQGPHQHGPPQQSPYPLGPPQQEPYPQQEPHPPQSQGQYVPSEQYLPKRPPLPQGYYP